MSKTKKIRLYIEDSIEQGKIIELNSEQKNYLVNVMRLRDRDTINIFNESSGEWIAAIKIEKKSYLIPIEKLRQLEQRKKKIVLCFAPTKRYGEFTAEKATELGVDCIIPIKCERSVVDKINHDRYRKAIIEAAEQCGRMDLPKLSEMICLKNLMQKVDEIYCKNDKLFLICDLNSDMSDFTRKNSEIIAIVVGPEGGFGPRDKEILSQLNGEYLNLGKNTLRAETASIASIAIVKSKADI